MFPSADWPCAKEEYYSGEKKRFSSGASSPGPRGTIAGVTVLMRIEGWKYYIEITLRFRDELYSATFLPVVFQFSVAFEILWV